MKKIVLLTVALVALAGIAHAQNSYLELLRSDVRTEKVAIITEALALTEEQGVAFWPIYREYEVELSKLGDETIALLKDYAENWGSYTDEKANTLVKAVLKNDGSRTKLYNKYYGKFAKATTPVLAARWLQLERAINALIRVQIAAEMPLIE